MKFGNESGFSINGHAALSLLTRHYRALAIQAHKIKKSPPAAMCEINLYSINQNIWACGHHHANACIETCAQVLTQL